MELNKKVYNGVQLNGVKLKRLHPTTYKHKYLIETKNGEFFTVIKGHLVSELMYDGTIIYKQHNLYVKKIEWEIDRYNVLPINDFTNKQYYEKLYYKPVVKDATEIKCYADFCKNIKMVYDNGFTKVVKRIHLTQKPETIVSYDFSYDYVF